MASKKQDIANASEAAALFGIVFSAIDKMDAESASNISSVQTEIHNRVEELRGLIDGILKDGEVSAKALDEIKRSLISWRKDELRRDESKNKTLDILKSQVNEINEREKMDIDRLDVSLSGLKALIESEKQTENTDAQEALEMGRENILAIEEIRSSIKKIKILKGQSGKIPDHEWNGTLIRFEQPDGSWGEYVNLQGPPGAGGESPFGAGMGGVRRIRAGSGITISGDPAEPTISSSIAQLSKTLTYNGDGSLNSVTDSSGSKTFGYTDGVLTSITGTGMYRNKTFHYTAGILDSITVS